MAFTVLENRLFGLQMKSNATDSAQNVGTHSPKFRPQWTNTENGECTKVVQKKCWGKIKERLIADNLKDFGTQNDTWYLLRRVWQFWTQLAKKTESEGISQQVYRSFWGVALVIQIMQWLIFLFNPVKLGQCLHVNKRKVSTMELKHMWTMERFVDWNKNPQDVCDGSCSSRFGCLCGNLLRKSLVDILDLALVKIPFATTQHVVVPNSRA